MPQGGVGDGPAGGQGVGGGAGGGGDDQAVGPVGGEVFVVDPGGEFGDAGQGPLVDHRVVQDVFLPDGLTIPDEGDGEDQALFHLEFSGQDVVFQAGVEFVQGDLGEEPQAAHVDPQDGEAQAAVMAGDAQDGAVAAHDHDEVGVRGQGQDGGLRFVFQVVGRQAPGLKPGQQVLAGLTGVGFILSW